MVIFYQKMSCDRFVVEMDVCQITQLQLVCSGEKWLDFVKKVNYDTEADLGGRGGRTPPLSEFETLVMGNFVPAHAPPIPPPQVLFLLGSYIK